MHLSVPSLLDLPSSLPGKYSMVNLFSVNFNRGMTQESVNIEWSSHKFAKSFKKMYCEHASGWWSRPCHASQR